MSQIVSSDAFTFSGLSWARDLLNGSAGLWLWGGDLIPTPATPLAAFVEATFPGYTRKNLSASWGTPVKLMPGLYQMQSGPWSWTPTGDGEPVSGWLVVIGSALLLSARLNVPITPVAGSPFSITLAFQSAALAVL